MHPLPTTYPPENKGGRYKNRAQQISPCVFFRRNLI
jgi:hypothetical protein